MRAGREKRGSGEEALGLATTATHAIWIVAILTAVGLNLDAYFETKPLVEEARATRVEHARERVNTLLNTTWCFVGQRVSVVAQNQGIATLSAQNSTIVIDGAPHNDFNYFIDGRSGTGVWAPDQNATFNRTGFASEPASVMFVAPNGVRSHPYQTICTLAVHIDAMATYKDNVTASVFQRGTDTIGVRTTIVESDGLPFEGATVTLQWIRPNSVVDHTDTATSGADGVAAHYWSIPNGALRGMWTARVTLVSGTGLTWDTGADVVTSVQFEVTN